MADKTVTLEQTGSPIRREKSQRATLIGLGLNKRHRRKTLKDTPDVRGMMHKVRHLVRIVEGDEPKTTNKKVEGEEPKTANKKAEGNAPKAAGKKVGGDEPKTATAKKTEDKTAKTTSNNNAKNTK